MSDLWDLDPKTLVNARALCHLGCQWPSKAARANLVAAADDSHSNLGWHSAYKALLSRTLDKAGRLQLGFRFVPSSLIWLVDGVIDAELMLAGANPLSADQWVDAQLVAASLHGTDQVVMPYELPDAADFSEFGALTEEVAALAAWFDYGQRGLEHLVEAFGARCVTPPTVRCWPHHFDIGSLFVLEAGDPETARSVGVGLAPGDGSFAEPYFYFSPYPQPSSTGLPSVQAPLFWNTEGFVSVIVRASDIDANSKLDELLSAAFLAAHNLL